MAGETPARPSVRATQAGTSIPRRITNDQTLEQLLAGQTGTVVAFRLPHIATQLASGLDLPVIGIDLSTMFEADKKKTTLPSSLVASRVYSKVNKVRVDRLWTDGDSKNGEELRLRAWITAWYA